MKKILLATTALVAFGGTAYAQDAAKGITLSGYAEIGVDGGNKGYNTQFHNDWQVNFNFASETDGGLSFGGKVQIEEINGAGAINGGLKIDDEAFWVSGDFGKVTLGETAGALDWAVPDVFSGTSISDDHSTHAGAYWNTGLDVTFSTSVNGTTYDNQIMRYEYSFGSVAVAGSVMMDDKSTVAGGHTHADPVLGIGAKWSGAMAGTDVTAGIGYQGNGDSSTWSVGATAKMANGFSASLGYADFSSDAAKGQVFSTSLYVANGVPVKSWVGAGVAYTTGALTVGANYGMYSVDNSLVTAGDSYDDPKGWGLVANYDLGGGAVAMFGYGSSSGSKTVGAVTTEYGSGNGHGTKTWSAGLGMSF